MKKIVYPGSFDPLTNGHLDILKRSVNLFENVIIAVLNSHSKKYLLTIEERLHLITEATKHIQGIQIVSFEGLLADFCKKNDIQIIVRGLRSVTDFDYEKAIALMNKSLLSNLETVFLTATSEHAFVSSTIVKEVAFFGGNIDSYVPPVVNNYLKEKYKK